MKKIRIFAIASLIMISVFILCRADIAVEISTSSGADGTASIGDVISMDTEFDFEYTLYWYCGGELVAEGEKSVTVTADMLGKSVYAVIKTEDGEYRSNSVTIPAQVPTIELTGTPGDYSAVLRWSAHQNGSEITHYDVSYALLLTPDVIIDTVTLDGGENSYVINDLSGGSSYIIRLTAYNEIGGTSASVTVKPNDPDLDSVTAVKNEIESKPLTIHMNLCNTEQAVKNYLKSYFSKYKDYGVKIEDITVKDFKAAKKKTADDPNAEKGSFRYIAELSKGSARLTTKSINAVIDNSTSIVYLTSDRYDVLTGESVTVTANKVDINSNAYVWYRAQSETGDGTVIENEVMPTYSPDTSKADDFYIYCVCGGVTSDRIRITVTDPFIKVTDILLSEKTVKAHESLVLRAVIAPANASASSIVWSVTDDGGCKVKLTGRIFTAERAGTVTLCATVKDGLETEDFKKTFTVTVTEDAKETEPVPDTGPEIYDTVIDCRADAVSNVSMTVENGSVQITALSDKTLEKMLSECGISKKEYDVVFAVKLVYSEKAVAENVVFELEDKTEREYKAVVGNNNGAVNVADVKSTGSIAVNTVSPDTVIVLKRNGMTDAKGTAVLLITAAVPVVVALIFIPVCLKMTRKKRKIKK
ncbi:MAG: fibronectin type III domain-containing protein [Clostridia bacterium]|nr:fibronectin type III domain-containing protein [Clostridia bacterium]